MEIMNTVTASSVINRLNSIFAIYGFPNSMLTDNDPPWNSTDIIFFQSNRYKTQMYYTIMAKS